VAGNRIGRPFEVDAEAPQVSERARGTVVPFRIGGPLERIRSGESGPAARPGGANPRDNHP
ncbi:MAG: hypothetical protein OXG35_25955, partial [Acidobacteria bacterium]|nr:hypothetical protein [Acidobacteriota bacterium]